MSKRNVRRKTSFKKDPIIGDRISDDEANRRRPCYQLTEKENQRQLLIMNDLRKNHLEILQNILSNHRNGQIKPKNHPIRNGKTHKTRPTSAKNVNSSDQNESLVYKNDNQVVHLTTENRLSRLNRKDDQQHQRITRSQSHPHSNNIRSTHNVSLTSDEPKNDRKSKNIESNKYPSSSQFKKLLAQLSSELNHLESLTGFKPNENHFSAYSGSTSLAMALLGLVGHVKKCASNSNEISYLKDQLSMLIQTQLDFQQKIENQITTLQTMTQTLCQLVNHELISNKKSQHNQTDLEPFESRENWLNNAQRPYLIEKDTSNAMDELLLFTRRMNNASPVGTNLYYSSSNDRHSAYIETLEASKKPTRPISAISTNGHDISKQIQQHRNLDQASRSSVISPTDIPLFESALPNGNSSSSIHQIDGISTTVPPASPTETILEKILQERLRLVQQMNELNKQHEMTQEELAHLEAKTLQTQAT